MIRSLLATLLLVSFKSNCQTVVDSISVKYNDIQVSSIGLKDSLFLRIKSPSLLKDQWFWLSKDGRHQEIDLKELNGEFIFAITKSDDKTTYYYFRENSKRIIVNYTQVPKDGSTKFSRTPFAIDGRFIGSYLDSTLHILTFNKKEKFLLTDTEIDDGSKIEERDFPLSINLSNYKVSQIASVDEGGYQYPMQSKALVKIYNRKKELVIVADDPYEQFKNEQNTFFTTTVIRIDKQTRKAVTNTLFEQSQENFRSIVWGDYLFRLTYNTYNGVNGVELVVHQLDNMKDVKIQHIPFKAINKIARLGEANRTIELYPEGKKRRKVDVGRNPSPFVLVDSLGNNNLVLMLGSNFEPSSGVPIMFPGAAGLIAASAMFFITASLQELSWGSSNQLYTYLSGDLKSDFAEIDLKKSSPGIIDRFEMAMDDNYKKFDFKGYSMFNKKIYYFYKLNKSKLLKIVAVPKSIDR
jgi:hypothetical protein